MIIIVLITIRGNFLSLVITIYFIFFFLNSNLQYLRWKEATEETISREINHEIFEITFSRIHPSILSQSLAPHPYTPPPFINRE